MTSPFEIRRVRPDQLDDFRRTMGVPFGFDPGSDPAERDRFDRIFEIDRLRAAFDGDRMVSTFGAFSLQLNVPGGRVPTAGTTVVTTLPTHRRRGILRETFAQHFRELHEAGTEPLAALWASETMIYGRYGYGPACERWLTKIDRPSAALRDPVDIAGTMRLVDVEEALTAFPSVFERSLGTRPGCFAESPDWWRYRALSDPESYREGATAKRFVLHERQGEPAGYVTYRTAHMKDSERAEVRIVELVGVDTDAERSLWQFVFGIDLAGRFGWWNQPVDDPLPWWLTNARELDRKRDDTLWVRLVDVPAALAARRYDRHGTLVLRVRDEFCPWNDGTVRLEADEDGIALCEPSSAEPDLELTASTLASTYLGAHRFTDLARAGLVRGHEPALRQADAMFGWLRLPWCQEVF